MLIHSSTCCFTVLLAVSRLYLLIFSLYLLVLQFYLLHTIQYYIMSTSQAGSSSPFRAGLTYTESGRLSIDTIDDAGSMQGFQGDSIDTVGDAGTRQGFQDSIDTIGDEGSTVGVQGDRPALSQPPHILSRHVAGTVDRVNMLGGDAGSTEGVRGDGPALLQPPLILPRHVAGGVHLADRVKSALLAAGFPPSINGTSGADVQNLLVEQHVDARERAAFVRVPAPPNVSAAVIASSPSLGPEAKRARSLEPRPAYVGSNLASAPEGAPCVVGLEPEVARLGARCSDAPTSACTLALCVLHPCPPMLACATHAGLTGPTASRRHAGNVIFVAWV